MPDQHQMLSLVLRVHLDAEIADTYSLYEALLINTFHCLPHFLKHQWLFISQKYCRKVVLSQPCMIIVMKIGALCLWAQHCSGQNLFAWRDYCGKNDAVIGWRRVKDCNCEQSLGKDSGIGNRQPLLVAEPLSTRNCSNCMISIRSVHHLVYVCVLQNCIWFSKAYLQWRIYIAFSYLSI